MKNENSRNTIIFIVCSVLILGIYWFTVLRPQAERRAAQQSAQAEQSQTAENAANTALSPQGPVFVTDRTQALGTAARVPIQSGTLRGSLSLQGARIDDLFLTDYREVQDDPAPVELFRPQGMEHAYFAQFGWAGANIPGGVPGPNTPWRLTAGSTLTPTTPITLTWDNGQGLRFTRMVSVDDKYVFTLKDTVQNLGTQPITIAPYGSVQRQGVPPAAGSSHIVHEGAIGAFGKPGEYRTEQKKYKDWLKEPRIENASTGGWLGITDKYWLAALLPQQNEAVQTEFRVRDANGGQQLEANLLGASRTIQPGATTTETQRLFAGVKRAEVLKSYEESLGLPRFVYAIDWGMFWFLTRPIFWILENVYAVVGSFGIAILALTVIVKLVMFPLANNAYASMSKMRNLQPKMEEIRKKHKDDPQKQQQEMMGLYQKEKINPVAGCLPLLLQIPVFYALYKVLTVTIEMRHQPFLGFIHDLSARDPSSMWNLFGLIPWDPSALPVLGGLLGGPLHIGLLAIAYGLTMWLQTAMNPPATDPMQRQIFQFMPLVFTFIMAPFAAGLLVYWAWSNILTILQQYVIMHRYKAENPIDSFIGRFKKSPA
ncbi:membrane protein insertase YidC [Brevundimonas sp.]|uniref:membrane protein insertase YidC n=1 Tax=Brevundimonas sp. TaxID=1871086 RepID=UPI0019C405F9|nr:membrane protein insertase YidC [Brevundimonas sp.]MBD3837487.1 membrane protein insertase YidC [Brevundimonas sp.]